jgi:hypothetical protein
LLGRFSLISAVLLAFSILTYLWVVGHVLMERERESKRRLDWAQGFDSHS